MVKKIVSQLSRNASRIAAGLQALPEGEENVAEQEFVFAEDPAVENPIVKEEVNEVGAHLEPIPDVENKNIHPEIIGGIQNAPPPIEEDKQQEQPIENQGEIADNDAATHDGERPIKPMTNWAEKLAEVEDYNNIDYCNDPIAEEPTKEDEHTKGEEGVVVPHNEE